MLLYLFVFLFKIARLSWHLYELSCMFLPTDCEDAGDDFVKYPEKYIEDDEYDMLHEVTEDFCIQQCISDSECWSFDYDYDSMDCELSTETAFTIGQGAVIDVSSQDRAVTHFQRTCDSGEM